MAEITTATYEYELVPQNNNNPITVQRTFVMEEGTKTRQYIAACAGNLAAMSAGIVLTWTSPSLPKLQEEKFMTESPLPDPITDTESSWISSSLALAAAFGPIIAGVLADKIGRKIMLLLSGLPFIIGWILMATTTTVAQILVARVLWGLSVGAVFTVLPMYIGEISESSIRGALGSFMQLFITFGILFSYVVGPYVSFKVLCYASVIWPALFVLLFFFMPESPYFLLGQNKMDAGEKALMYLRGKSKDGVQKELLEIKDNVDESAKQAGTIKDLFASRGTTTALTISLGLVGFQQLSGINAVLFFAQPIFDASNESTGTAGENASGSLSSAQSSIIIGVVQVVASAVTPLVVDRLGRKLLLLISGAGMALALFVLGLFFNLKTGGTDVDAISFLPILSLVCYMCVYCIGFGPLPWAVMGELFSTNIKSLASMATASFCWLLGFLITQYFKSVSDQIGMDWAFWIFAMMCVAAFAFVFLLLPETKGKTLQEIQDILEGNTK